MVSKKPSTHDEVWNFLHLQGFSLGMVEIFEPGVGFQCLVDARDEKSGLTYKAKGENPETAMWKLLGLVDSAKT